MAIKQCEHCGKPVAIPDGVDEGKLKKIVEEALNGQLGDFCQRFPALCGQVSSLEKRTGKIEEAITSHPTPSEGLLEQWQNCPDCKPKLDKLIADGKFKPPEPEEKEELPFAFMEHD